VHPAVHVALCKLSYAQWMSGCACRIFVVNADGVFIFASVWLNSLIGHDGLPFMCMGYVVVPVILDYVAGTCLACIFVRLTCCSRRCGDTNLSARCNGLLFSFQYLKRIILFIIYRSNLAVSLLVTVAFCTGESVFLLRFDKLWINELKRVFLFSSRCAEW